MRSRLSTLAVLGLLFTGCATQSPASSDPTTPSTTCTPPAGGRCAADVPWPGPIMVSSDGTVLHGPVACGGTLTVVSQTTDRVAVRLHVGSMGPGTMSCARVDVSARLAAPLDGRPVYDDVTGKALTVLPKA